MRTSRLERARISRTPGPVSLRGLRCHTTAQLTEALLAWPGGEAPLFADLSLGAWRAHQVARELLAQLGLAPDALGAPGRSPPGPWRGLPSYADTVGGGIDTEGGGQASVSRALALARQVMAALGQSHRRTLVVLAPRAGLSWQAENVAFLRFLAQALREGPHTLLLASTGLAPPLVPSDWSVSWDAPTGPEGRGHDGGLARLVPGLLTPEVVAVLAGAGEEVQRHCLLLAQGCALVPTECRPPPSDVPGISFDGLAVAARRLPALAASAQMRGSNYHVDAQLLAQQAWRTFVEGGQELALAMMEHALACSRAPAERESLQAQAQGMRIALHRFHEAASAREPSVAAPPALRSFLLEAKGWGLVMSGQAERAAHYLADARKLQQLERDLREYLYLLNILALSRLKTGDDAGSLALENQIEAHLGELPRPDWPLAYVNAINTARLLVRAGRVQQAADYYQRAFATTLGARSESDRVYTNVCQARVQRAAGQPFETFRAWLRAGLHWAAAASPEALSPRVIQAILRGPPPPAGEHVEAVSLALYHELQGSAAAVGIPLAGEEGLSSRTFLGSEELQDTGLGEEHRTALGGSGWSVITTDRRYAPAFDGPGHRKLRGGLAAVLRGLLPSGTDLAGSLIVDDRLGTEMARTYHELLETALRLRLEHVTFEGVTFHLTSERRLALEAQLRLAPGPAVDSMKLEGGEATVTFKRYLAPWKSEPEQARLLSLLTPRVPDLASRLGCSTAQLFPLLRALEHARVLELSLPEDVHVPEGLVPGRVRA